MTYLMHSVLLKRYSIISDGEATPPVNVIEKAVDLHALRVIGSSGYQVRFPDCGFLRKGGRKKERGSAPKEIPSRGQGMVNCNFVYLDI